MHSCKTPSRFTSASSLGGLGAAAAGAAGTGGAQERGVLRVAGVVGFPSAPRDRAAEVEQHAMDAPWS